jgi:hypothetical protein
MLSVGHAKLQRRWALDFLVLPLLAGVPLSRSYRTSPGAPGGRWSGRGVGGWLGLGLGTSTSQLKFLGGHI